MMKKRFVLLLTLECVLPALAGALMLGAGRVDLDGAALEKSLGYAIAALFWLSLAAEIAASFLAARLRKQLVKQTKRRLKKLRSYPGIICFARNPGGLLSDILLLVSAVGNGFLLWTGRSASKWYLPCVLILFVSFQYHCVLNGANYQFWRECLRKEKEHGKDGKNEHKAD